MSRVLLPMLVSSSSVVQIGCMMYQFEAGNICYNFPSGPGQVAIGVGHKKVWKLTPGTGMLTI